MQWYCLAPGPSMSACLAERVRGNNVAVVGNTYTLAPWADVLIANDSAWWRRYPEAKQFAGRKFSANAIADVERVMPNSFGTQSNSGVLALDVLRNLGATKIVLLGFDMHGSHYFGPYRNGLRNTSEQQRKNHLRQFRDWRLANPKIDVINCTEGSALTCFPVARLDETGLLEPASDEAGQGGDVCQRVAA